MKLQNMCTPSELLSAVNSYMRREAGRLWGRRDDGAKATQLANLHTVMHHRKHQSEY